MLSVQNLNVTFNTRKGNVDAVKDISFNRLQRHFSDTFFMYWKNEEVLDVEADIHIPH